MGECLLARHGGTADFVRGKGTYTNTISINVGFKPSRVEVFIKSNSNYMTHGVAFNIGQNAYGGWYASYGFKSVETSFSPTGCRISLSGVTTDPVEAHYIAYR